MIQKLNVVHSVCLKLCKVPVVHSRRLSHFRVLTHTVRAQHTRERPASTELGQQNDIRISLKQYIPHDNSHPSPGDLTLIGAHANAFPKELYEPLWDELHEKLKRKGQRIRGIWIADIAQQGVSGRLNAQILGPDPSWWDHGRDLMFIINQFQDQMPQPLMGIGHSMGGFHLAHLSLLHPNLLQSLVLIDPVIQSTNPSFPYARASTYRRANWPSRSVAAEKFRSSRFYQAWDSRVLDKWIEFGLTEIPDATGEALKGESPVELATSVAQEVFMFLRPAYEDARMLTGPEQRRKDMYPQDIEAQDEFYRPEPSVMMRRLPEITPNVMYVFGSKSELSSEKARDDKLKATGIAYCGNGGVEKGGVEATVLDCGHLVPMEMTSETAQASADFFDRELKRWATRQEEYRKKTKGLTREQRTEIGELWKKKIGPPAERKKKEKS